MSELKLTSRASPSSWRAALDCISVDEQHVSAREVEDFCSLLSIAERVHVVGWRGGGHAATVLATLLTSLGYPTHGVGDRSVVEATDTVVAVCGPDPSGREPLSVPTLRSLTGSGAVLLAIVSADATPLLTVADVTITVPLPRPRGGDDIALASAAFDLMASMTADVIRRELTGRIARRHRLDAPHRSRRSHA